MTDITAKPFDWNDNLSKEALEDFEGIQKDLPYCTCQNIGMALAKLELLEKQGCKTGHWIMSDDGLYRPICNNCGAHPWKGYIPTVEEATEMFKYCPNCGTKMFEPQERSDKE